MITSKSTARLRMVRELLGRTGEGEEEGAEAGFTLIELMVVLLIMAILLAIAIPTFLSVTNGAKKTATQSDLTNALVSATAIYTNSQSFPTLPATAPTATGSTTGLIATMTKTQTTITFKAPGTTTAAVLKAKNVLSTYTPGTGSLAVFSGIDGATGCWYAADNQSNATIKGVGAGDKFYGVKVTSASTWTKNCKATYPLATAHHPAWVANFKTVTGVT